MLIGSPMKFTSSSSFQLVQWYTLKKNNPLWFASKPLSNYLRLLDKKIHCMLETRDSKNRRVYVIKLGNIVVSEQPCYELSNIDDLWLEATLDEPDTAANGMVFLLDLKGIPYGIMKYLTPTNCRIGARKAELVPLRVMEYHLVNGGMLLNAIVSLVFPFLAEESKKNIHFHNSNNNFSSLHKFVNPEALPPEYGGTLDQIDFLKCRTLLTDREEKILEGFAYGYRSEEKNEDK
ncbi:hypothetical protein M8J75_013206 [Diaphorina citri]|nr:hypothetical protein M8J75_013206 [Diaphorina citri]